jgi:replicative DNA helicase
MNSKENILPNRLEVEKAVLGSMMFSENAFNAGIEELDSESFYSNANSIIFSTMSAMFSLDMPVDLVTIANQLTIAGSLELVGGTPYLSEIAEQVATAFNISEYIKILKDQQIKRQLISSCREIESISLSNEDSAEDIMQIAESKVHKITDSDSTKESGLVSTDDEVKKTVEYLEKCANHEMLGLPTGIKSLDQIIGGLCEPDLVIIAGRPGSGKTSLALGMAINLAVEQEKRIAVFSCEMSRQQLMIKAISQETGISYHTLITGQATKKQFDSIGVALQSLSIKNLMIDDTARITISKIRSRCRRMISKLGGLDAIFIDYIQIMGVESQKKDRRLEIDEITSNLKGLAKLFHIPVIALSQLSRECERRTDKRPMLSDLKESGGVEADADVVIFCYRGEYYFKDDEKLKGKAELIVEKQRNGPCDTAHVSFRKESAKFMDNEPEAGSPGWIDDPHENK